MILILHRMPHFMPFLFADNRILLDKRMNNGNSKMLKIGTKLIELILPVTMETICLDPLFKRSNETKRNFFEIHFKERNEIWIFLASGRIVIKRRREKNMYTLYTLHLLK